MSEPQQPSRSELLAEVDRLRAEVDRLHDLMGFDNRSSDGHLQAWAPTLFGGSDVTPHIAHGSEQAEKVALIRSLFGARSDVYAQRWENQRTNKSGWSPAARGRLVFAGSQEAFGTYVVSFAVNSTGCLTGRPSHSQTSVSGPASSNRTDYPAWLPSPN